MWSNIFRLGFLTLSYLPAALLWGAVSVGVVFADAAQASSTQVGKIRPSIKPFEPPPANTDFTLYATFVAVSHGQPCDISNVRATINGKTIASYPSGGRLQRGVGGGSSGSVTFIFPYKGGFPAGTDLTPTFSYVAVNRSGSDCSCSGSSCVTPDPFPPVPPAPEPNLVVEKTRTSPAQVVPGDPVAYTITVTNKGTGDAANVSIVDNLNTNLLYSSSGLTPDAAPAVGDSGQVRWTINSLAASGGSVAVQLLTTVASSAPAGVIGNSASATVSGTTTNSNNVDVTVNRTPNISLLKTINGRTSQRETLPAGSTVTYVLTYENVGSGDAANVTITDVLDPQLTGTPTLLPASGTWNPATREVSWNVGAVGAGDGEQSVAFQAQIDPTASTLFSNIAEVTWTGGSNNSNPAVVDLIPEPSFELTKAVDQKKAGPGDELTYTINYENVGSAAGVNTVVTDTIPAGLTPVAGSYPGATYTAGATVSDPDTLTWSLGSVAASATGSLTYKVTVDAGAPAGSLVNLAAITADNVFGSVVATANTSITVVGVIDLSASKTLQAGSAQYVGDGDLIAYDLSVTNAGNATATDVLLVDPLPQGTALDAARSPGWSVVGGNLELSLPDIAGRSTSAVYPLVLTVDGSQLTDGELISNQATGTGTDPGGQTDSAVTGLVSVTYNAPATVSLVKRAIPLESVPQFPGDEINYTIEATLETITGVSDLSVGDILPAGLEYINAFPTPEEVTNLPDGRTSVIWPEEALNSGSTQYSVKAKVRAFAALGEQLNNITHATYGQSSTSAFTRHVVSDASVSITKTVSSGQQQIVPGEELDYTITYSNTGQATLTGVTVTDALPANTTALQTTPVASTPSVGVLSWSLKDLAPGQSETLLIKLDTTGVAVGDNLKNSVTIQTNEAQPKSASVETLVRDVPSLSLDKVVDKPTTHPGETVTFTLSYENMGAGAALNTVLTDTLPAELDFVSASDGKMPDPVTGVISWNLGDIAGGAVQAKKTVTARVLAGSYVPAVTVTNSATLTSDTDFDGATAQVVITEQPAFTITKSVAGGATPVLNHASPGDTVHYTLEVNKTGGAATGVQIADILPGQVSYVDGSANFPIDAALSDPDLGLLVWNIGSVPEGNKALSLSFNATLDPVITNGTAIENVSFVDSVEQGLIESNPVTTIVDSKPVLVVTKQASDAYIFSPPTGSGEVPGTVTFSVEVENQGDSVAEDVVVSDTLPAGLIVDPASTSAAVTGNTVEWSVGDLEPGRTVTLQVAAEAEEGLAGNITLLNKALASTTTVGVGAVPSNEVTVTVVGEAVFILNKKASAVAVKPGESFTYTLEYMNVGTDDSGPITLEDTLPPDVTFISASDGGAATAPSSPLASPGVVKWVDLPALSPGQVGTLQIAVEVNAVVANGTSLPNTATLYETATPAKSVQAQFVGKVPTVASAPLLTILKTVDSGPTIPAGDLVTFNINYQNVGGDAATNPEIRDVLPAGLSIESATGNPTISGNVIIWQTASLPAKQSGDLKLIARADNTIADGTPLTNSVSITSVETPTPVSSSATVKVLSAAMAMTKTVDKATANSGVSATSTQGDVLTYTIGFENTGSIDATGVTVVDSLPQNVTLEGATPAPTTVSGGLLTWTIGAVQAGDSGSISLQVRVGDDLRDGTQLVNAASLTSTNAGAASAPPVTTTVVSSAVLSIEKTSAVTQVIPGQEFSYEITVSNSGSDTAENVVITDTLPSELSVVDTTANGVVSADTVSWSIGDMMPNTTTSVQVKVKVADVIAVGTVLLNKTTATGNQPGGAALPPVADTLQTPVSSEPVLVLQYSVDKAIAAPGDRLTYALRVRNAGNADAVNPIVEAGLPPNTSPDTVSGSGRFQQDKAVWTAPSLAPGGFIDLQFTLNLSPTVPDGTKEPSVAAFGASNAATQMSSVITKVVVAEPVLTVTKLGPNSVEAGTAIAYELSYSNSGNAAAANTVLEDTLPPGTTFVSASAGGAETSPGSGIVRWDLGTLAAGGSGNVDLQVQTTALPDNTQLVNQTSLTSTTLPGAVTAAATTIVRSHTELDVTIVAANDPVKVGDRQLLTVTWANSGNQDTTNAVVKATVPADTTFDVAGSGGTLSGNEVTWAVGNLAAGDVGQATFEVLVASTAVDGEQLKSVADITATDGLPDTDEAIFIVDDTPDWPIVTPIDIPVAPERLLLLMAGLLTLLAYYQLTERRRPIR